ncbi:hypothetical protein SBI67_26210 [Mycolicibacterium sp. 120266]|uniref:hypothetical protein n=1 Tax=Mycolicibacterium sp. 120266 TaxID=3090601 RepID=UPI00299D5BD3|nr:hypothetical protein [Mycolicibacterium sp. 120266]MDX1875629.1 hypothetical protein [Mycolicibacterium sp. 120266]
MNKSASLTAGVCSLCITASLAVAPPHAAAAALPVVQHRSVSVLENPYALTASSTALQNLLLVAGLPLNNLNTTLSTLGGLTNFVTGLNLALGNIYKGNWDQVPANLAKAWADEVAAIQKVIALPQTLIKYDAAVIGNFLAGLGGAGATLATSKSAAALPTAQTASASALLVVLGIPFNNLNTTLSTIGGLTNFVTGLNLALGNIYKGNWDQVPANLQKAWTDEVAAFKKVLELPQTLLNYDIKAISNLFAPPAAASTAATFVKSERVATLALPTASSSTETDSAATADEATGTKKDSTVKEPTEVKDTTTEAKDPTDVKDTTTEAKDPTDVKDTATDVKDTTGTKTPSDEKSSTGTKDTTGTGTGTGSTGTESGSSTTKAGDKDAGEGAGEGKDSTDSGKSSTTGKHSAGSGTYGRHARQDDGNDSTASASSGTSTTSATGGRHRKPEGSSSTGSTGSSSSSTGGEHSSAA